MIITPIQLLRVPDVAARLDVCDGTVWRMLRRGELPRVKIGQATRVPADAVDAFIAGQVEQ